MTPAEAIIQFGAVHKAVGRTNPATTVHVTETCKELRDDTDTRELVHPGQLPLSATLFPICQSSTGQEAAADGGETQ